MNDPTRRRQIIGTTGGIVLGAVLLFAAWTKALDLNGFAAQIRTEGLDFLLPARVVASIALALEAGLGLALVLGIRRRWLLITAALLVAFFVFLTGRNYWLVSRGLRSPTESCGCFGDLIVRTPAEAFWQDLLLLIPATVLAFVGRPRPTGSQPWRRLAAATVMALAVVVFAGMVPPKPHIPPEKQLAPTSALRQFSPASGYFLEIDGQVARDAEIYQSQESASFLIVAPGFSRAFLMRLQTSSIDTFDRGKIIKTDENRVDLFEDTRFEAAGKFEVTGGSAVFAVNGRRLELKTRPE